VFAAIYFESYRRISAIGFCAFLIFLVTVDLAAVDKRYFTENNYKRNRDNTFFALTPADQAILQDKSVHRVYNLSYLTGNGENPFAEARTSYYHNSIGGYHGAKLRRYSEFYDSCMVAQTQQFVDRASQGNMSFNNLHSINMLNVKYVLIGQQANQVLPNPDAYGNAWFVEEIVSANDADSELSQTCAANTRRVAVINTTEFQVGSISADSSATIRLADHTPRTMKYESESQADGLAVFSEIWYPGWEATIDGKPAEVLRADYILRALQIPAGKHTIEFTFRPKPYTTGNTITTASSWIVFAFFIGAIVLSFKENRSEQTATGT